MRRRAMVDREGRLRPVVAERVVRDRCQVDHRVEAAQVVYREVSDVAVDRRRRSLGLRAHPAAAVEEAVHAGDVVPGRGDERDEDGPDVAVVAGYEDPHYDQIFQGGWGLA